MTSQRNFELSPLQGWRCPICGRIYSPNVLECNYCNNRLQEKTPYRNIIEELKDVTKAVTEVATLLKKYVDLQLKLEHQRKLNSKPNLNVKPPQFEIMV